MKKLLALSALVFLFSMCSTEIDLLDDWKETAVIYGLLDQNDSVQYVRIQKVFLGPDNAMDMAQQFDSINYVQTLDVKIEQIQNGNVINTFTLTPDTIYNKQPGDFYSPMQVIYSFATPSGLASNCTYHLVVNHVDASSNTVATFDATTPIVENFTIQAPLGPSVSFIKPNQFVRVEVRWSGASHARLYQLAMYFHYTETDINSVITNKTAPAWIIGEIETTSTTATQTQSIKFDPDAFYNFIANAVPQDDNIVDRKSDYVQFVVYACEEQMNNYMNINGPSSGLAQEKPMYTNINNGVGLFSARTKESSVNLSLTPQSLDSLSYGQKTCALKFEDRNGIVVGCQ